MNSGLIRSYSMKKREVKDIVATCRTVMRKLRENKSCVMLRIIRSAYLQVSSFSDTVSFCLEMLFRQ